MPSCFCFTSNNALQMWSMLLANVSSLFWLLYFREGEVREYGRFEVEGRGEGKPGWAGKNNSVSWLEGPVYCSVPPTLRGVMLFAGATLVQWPELSAQASLLSLFVLY